MLQADKTIGKTWWKIGFGVNLQVLKPQAFK